MLINVVPASDLVPLTTQFRQPGRGCIGNLVQCSGNINAKWLPAHYPESFLLFRLRAGGTSVRFILRLMSLHLSYHRILVLSCGSQSLRH